MFESKAAIRRQFDPIIAAYLAAGGAVAKFNTRGQRVA